MSPGPFACCHAQGAAAYAPEKEALVWKIRNFPGGKEFLLRAKFGLPSVAAEDEQIGRMPPIRVAYEIPYFTVSGIQASGRAAVAGSVTGAGAGARGPCLALHRLVACMARCDAQVK